MKNLKNKKGFTLVELLAVIVVLAIVMGMAVVGITSVLDNTRKSAFAADAKSYLEGAHQLVRTDEANALLGGSTTYAPSCSGTGSTTRYIPIDDIPLDSGGRSPYGNDYAKCNVSAATAAITSAPKKSAAGDCSYIKVTSTISGTKCSYSYSVLLYDGVYHIPETSELQVNAGKVAKK